MVFEYILRRFEGIVGDGTDAGRGSFYHRCAKGQ